MLVMDVVRHGEAGPADAGGDRGRHLSAGGVARVEELAEQLARERWKPDRVFSSPLVRALETASILARAAGANAPEIAPLEALEPNADPEDIEDALEARGAVTGHVALVGHQPLLGRLLARLTGEERKIPAGTLIRVRCPNGFGRPGGSIERVLSPAD